MSASVYTAKSQFGKSSFFVTKNAPQAAYAPKKRSQIGNVWIGQMKLMLGEIFFINYFWNPRENPNPIYVSIGAAGGFHYPILAKMFPSIEFHLYDGAEFGCSEEDCSNIRIFREFFTDETAAKYAAMRERVLLNSDVRRIFDDIGHEGWKSVIEEDMEFQRNWLEIIQPAAAMLKFTLPFVFPDPLTGEIEDITTRYLDGYLTRQVFGPFQGTEHRLIPVKKKLRDGSSEAYYYRNYSSLYHERVSSAFNLNIRSQKYSNIFNDEGSSDIYYPELLHDFDSTATAFILSQYYLKITGVSGDRKQVQVLFDLIRESISKFLGRKKMLSVATERAKVLSGKFDSEKRRKSEIV